MSVSKKDVEYIAELSKLKLEKNEIEKYTFQLNQILEYVEKLSELDTENVEPLSHPVENKNVFRDDKLKTSISTEEALKNASEKKDPFFKVPKVIKS
jgi:aspartyl-tRNA(Asn)/glutamyl-tRNA(Gln) amidotransferase subunit C